MKVQPLVQPWLGLAQRAGQALGRALVDAEGVPVRGAGWRDAVAAFLGVADSTLAARIQGRLPIPAAWLVAGAALPQVVPSEAGGPGACPDPWGAPGRLLSALSVPRAQQLARGGLDTGRGLRALLLDVLAHLREQRAGVALVAQGSSTCTIPVGVRWHGRPVLAQVLGGDGSVQVRSAGWGAPGWVQVVLTQAAATQCSISWLVAGGAE